MTTEQCSVDSLIPKSRTETFARQLQNRLRTLNSESERDGLEDTSWNGDQHSSSSDNDIYYDLDSYPGSPAEEATETDFSSYVNLKNSDNIYPSSSRNHFPNHDEIKLHSNEVECDYLEKFCRSDTLNNFENVNKITSNCTCCEDSERKCTVCCNGSPNKDFDGINNNSTQDKTQKCNNFSNSHIHDRLGALNHVTETEISSTETFSKFNGFSEEFTQYNQASNNMKNYVEETIPNHVNHISNGIESVQRNGTQDVSISCSDSNNYFPADVVINNLSFNSNNDNNDSNLFLPITITQNNTESTMLTNSVRSSSPVRELELIQYKCNNHVDLEGEENNLNSNSQTKEDEKEKYTEDDLCKLVDAVFLRSQENDFDLLSDVKESHISDDEKERINREEKDNEEEEEESIESRRSRFRRCSSLKTGKTPPGTPGHKKIVRFADVLGLDLADVRTFLDEIPKVPKSAFIDLKDVELPSSPPVHSAFGCFMGQAAALSASTINKLQRTIIPLFQQPSSRPDFLDRIRDQFVCLENAIVSDSTLSVITGLVRVKNIDYHKSVHIRYSIDNWKSFADLQAKYTPNSCDGFSDKFTFVLYAHMLNIGQRLEFAVRFHARGSLYWDNNYGANYSFQCMPEPQSKFVPSTTYASSNPAVESWASFY